LELPRAVSVAAEQRNEHRVPHVQAIVEHGGREVRGEAVVFRRPPKILERDLPSAPIAGERWLVTRPKRYGQRSAPCVFETWPCLHIPAWLVAKCVLGGETVFYVCVDVARLAGSVSQIERVPHGGAGLELRPLLGVRYHIQTTEEPGPCPVCSRWQG